MSKFSSTEMQLSRYIATTVSCTVFLKYPATRVRTVASDQIVEL